MLSIAIYSDQTNDAELLSYIINQDPVLSENIDLPVQGQSIEPIGKLIMSNAAYRNALDDYFYEIEDEEDED